MEKEQHPASRTGAVLQEKHGLSQAEKVQETRKRRRAEALRANLRRRKQRGADPSQAQED